MHRTHKPIHRHSRRGNLLVGCLSVLGEYYSPEYQPRAEVASTTTPLCKVPQKIQLWVARNKPSHNPLLSVMPKDTIQWDNIARLIDNRWVTDDVINQLLKFATFESEATSTFSTFTIINFKDKYQRAKSAKRWINALEKRERLYATLRERKVTPLKESKIFFPIHVAGVHWAIYCIDMQSKKIKFYDPLGKSMPLMSLIVDV